MYNVAVALQFGFLKIDIYNPDPKYKYSKGFNAFCFLQILVHRLSREIVYIVQIIQIIEKREIKNRLFFLLLYYAFITIKSDLIVISVLYNYLKIIYLICVDIILSNISLFLSNDI